MLSSIVASKAARLMTLCICPVVGTGTVVMSVPKARQAVHNATAPREYALPKTRERLPDAPIAMNVPPCPSFEGPGLQTGYLETPPAGLFTSLPPGGGVPPGGGTLPPGGGGNGGVPEPGTWVQMIAGFLLLGGALRIARQQPSADERGLLDRVNGLRERDGNGMA